MTILTKEYNIVVFISGNGSNLQAIINAISEKKIHGKIKLVISNRETAYGLQRCKGHEIPSKTITLSSYKKLGKSRLEYDLDLASIIMETKPNLVVLGGFMHVLSKEFIEKISSSSPIINIHPALPGQFNGINAIERAFEAFQRGEIKNTGVMIHHVIPQVDMGEPILSQEVPVLKTDTLQDLENRIHEFEHRLLIEAINKILK